MSLLLQERFSRLLSPPWPGRLFPVFLGYSSPVLIDLRGNNYATPGAYLSASSLSPLPTELDRQPNCTALHSNTEVLLETREQVLERSQISSVDTNHGSVMTSENLELDVFPVRVQVSSEHDSIPLSMRNVRTDKAIMRV